MLKLSGTRKKTCEVRLFAQFEGGAFSEALQGLVVFFVLIWRLIYRINQRIKIFLFNTSIIAV